MDALVPVSHHHVVNSCSGAKKKEKCGKHALPHTGISRSASLWALHNKIQLGRDLQDCKFTTVFQK